MKHFRVYSRHDLLPLVKLRRFETKLGERIQVPVERSDLARSLAESEAKYVLFGIPEDIGVRGNYGIGGAASAWTAFLPAFLNIQSNDFLSGDQLLLAGCFDFGALSFLIEQNAVDNNEKIDACRHAVMSIDEEVEEMVKMIVASGKTPIAIGGGHNNAYPLIKGTAKGLLKTDRISVARINCINLDAHTDYRPAEGRHSGNAFRYADDDGFLEKYFVVAAQENYLPQNVLQDMRNNSFIELITWEDIFIREKMDFLQAVSQAISFTSDNYTGIELDLDIIVNVLSSAETPSGITTQQARQYVTFVARQSRAAYLHICEGAAQLADGRKSETMGKLVSFLVSDFIKA